MLVYSFRDTMLPSSCKRNGRLRNGVPYQPCKAEGVKTDSLRRNGGPPPSVDTVHTDEPTPHNRTPRHEKRKLDRHHPQWGNIYRMGALKRWGYLCCSVPRLSEDGRWVVWVCRCKARSMNRPSFLSRYPSVAPIALLVLWFAVGILEGLGY